MAAALQFTTSALLDLA